MASLLRHQYIFLSTLFILILERKHNVFLRFSHTIGLSIYSYYLSALTPFGGNGGGIFSPSFSLPPNSFQPQVTKGKDHVTF
jgi:hypothetical protein